MAHQQCAFVKETSTTTGTGSYSLAGAVTGFRAFSAVCADGDTVYYSATDGTNWEEGLGTWNTGNTLARTEILASSNGGSAVNWGSGTKTIALVAADRTLPLRQFSLLQSDATLSNSAGVQTWCGGATSQDVFSVKANTTYRFRGQYYMSTGTTTHTTAMAFALSGATVSRFEYQAMLWSAAANTIATTQSTTHVTGVASKVLNATSTTAATIIQFEGTAVFANGGTITPQINFSAAPGGTNLMKAGSWVEFEELGPNTVTKAGGWG